MNNSLFTKVARPALRNVRWSSGDPVSTARTMKLSKALSFTVVPVGVALCVWNAIRLEKAHHTHDRPEFVKYEYLAVRNKKFPWGDGNKGLFHNPQFNALPAGYEEEWHGGEH